MVCSLTSLSDIRFGASGVSDGSQKSGNFAFRASFYLTRLICQRVYGPSY